MLLENSIYTNEEEKELFLKDKVLIADAFYINVIGFLSLYSISHKRGLIKTYMSNKNVALAHIADESNDLLVSLKAYNHIGGITMETTNKVSRILSMITAQFITSKDINEIEIRELVGECKLETHRPNPLIYAITKKFIEGDSLIHLAKEYYQVIKGNKKIKGVSKELVKIMSQYTATFKKQDDNLGAVPTVNTQTTTVKPQVKTTLTKPVGVFDNIPSIEDAVNIIMLDLEHHIYTNYNTYDLWYEMYGNTMMARLVNAPNLNIIMSDLLYLFGYLRFTCNRPIEFDVFKPIIVKPEDLINLTKHAMITQSKYIKFTMKFIAELTVFLYTPKEFAGIILGNYDVSSRIKTYLKMVGELYQDKLLDALLKHTLTGFGLTVLTHSARNKYELNDAIIKSSDASKLSLFTVLINEPSHLYPTYIEMFNTFSSFNAKVKDDIIVMLSKYLNTILYKQIKLEYTLDFLISIIGIEYYLKLRDMTFDGVDKMELKTTTKTMPLFMKMSNDNELKSVLATYTSYPSYARGLGKTITVNTAHYISTELAIDFLKTISSLPKKTTIPDNDKLNLTDLNAADLHHINDTILFTEKIVSAYVTGEISSAEINTIYDSTDRITKLIILNKLAHAHILKETTKNIMQDNYPIKPYYTLTATRMADVLRHNNIDLDIHGITLDTNASFNIAENHIKENAGQVHVLDDIKATQVELNEFDLDAMTLDYDKFNNRAHGNTAVKFLRSFNVDIPLMNEQYDKFLAKFGGNITPKYANYIAPQFHGTGSIAASMILRYGFAVISTGDPATVGRMLGDGIYLTNVTDKCSQYISDKGYVGGSYNINNTGYILECEVLLGTKGKTKHYTTAGVKGSDNLTNIVSPEWVVFYPNMQIKIKKAHEVEVVPADYIDVLKKKRGIMESHIKPFKQFLFEGKTGGKEALTYIFRDGNIPISEDEYVEFEDFDPKAFGDNVKLDYTGSGPAVIIYNDKKTHTRVVPMITHFMRDQKLMGEYLSYLTSK